MKRGAPEKKSTTCLECSKEKKMFLECPREANLGDLSLFLDEPLFLTDYHDIIKSYQGPWIYDNLDKFIYFCK